MNATPLSALMPSLGARRNAPELEAEFVNIKNSGTRSRKRHDDDDDDEDEIHDRFHKYEYLKLPILVGIIFLVVSSAFVGDFITTNLASLAEGYLLQTKAVIAGILFFVIQKFVLDQK